MPQMSIIVVRFHNLRADAALERIAAGTTPRRHSVSSRPDETPHRPGPDGGSLPRRHPHCRLNAHGNRRGSSPSPFYPLKGALSEMISFVDTVRHWPQWHGIMIA
jgi:hypothetical protein